MAAANVEHMHKLFRGAGESAKWLGVFSLAIDSVAAIVATAISIGFPGASPWYSLALATMVVISAAIRRKAASAYSFSEMCRRTSARAFAAAEDISSTEVTSADADAPVLTVWLSQRLPATNLDEYYEPTSLPGGARLQEMYAHSAFYTWRLLNIARKIYFTAAVTFATSITFVIYALAAEQISRSIAADVLEIACSVVIALLLLRSADAWIDASESASDARKLADSLADARKTAEINRLASEYDILRARARPIPTFLYRIFRNRLQRQWRQRRDGYAINRAN